MFLLILAFTLSMDALTVGFSLGLKEIKIARTGFAVIGLTSFLLAFFAMVSGSLLGYLISPAAANFLGSFLLFAMGIWIILTGFLKADNGKHAARKEEYTIKELAFQSAGIAIRILKLPQDCDKDLSGQIDKKEALPLALALSVDMLAGGIGIGAMGLSSVFLPIIVGILQTGFLFLGNSAGKNARSRNALNEKTTNLLSGSILIVLAVFKII